MWEDTPQNMYVLILVLVEDGLRGHDMLIPLNLPNEGLNPCSCGGWSQRDPAPSYLKLFNSVLILVLVEDGLRVSDNR